MPKIAKQALSNYVRTGCDRQLRLTIATGSERRGDPASGIPAMPNEQPPRPGLQEAVREGIRWQHQKVSDLTNTFGSRAVIAEPVTTRSGVEYRPIDLASKLAGALSLVPATEPSVWLVEPEFGIGATLKTALGLVAQTPALGIEYARLRPDLVEMRPPGTAEYEVTPGGDTRLLAANDTRLRLRVIDIKLTAEPSPGYFAEVTLYSMALAGWLVDEGKDGQFVVVSDAALWPGSHEASILARTVDEIKMAGGQPTPEQMRDALAKDLEPVPLEVFVPEVRRFLEDDIPRVLAQPWTNLEYHVDNRCRNCPFLGAPWIDAEGNPTAEPGHCMKLAEAEGHLSRLAGVTRGARSALSQAGVGNVETLANRAASDPAFDRHFSLRGSRTVVQKRASVLHGSQPPSIAPQSGTSAIMPRWSDLRVHISVDFDASSAITIAFAVSAFLVEPRAYGSTTSPKTRSWGSRVFVVDQSSIEAEQRELIAFLRHLEEIFSDTDKTSADATFQVYLWDQLQLKHLTRVMGRHLPAVLADPKIADLAWLFPGEELVADPKALSRRSPITVIRDVVRSLLAAPVPHYYSLLELARNYHPGALEPQFAKFSVHPLFQDPLSDQIPSERAHEIWSRSENPNRPWMQQMKTLEETVKTRLRAAEQVRRRLEEDLGSELGQTAPKIGLGAMKPVPGLSQMSQLWLAYAKINAALNKLEVARARAMPPHERESRFTSARLEARLQGQARAIAVEGFGSAVQPSDLVYRMRDASREVKMREGDFGVALAPEGMPGLLDQKLSRIVAGTGLEVQTDWGNNPFLEQVLAMTVIALDRDAGIIALRPSDYWPAVRLEVPDLIERLESQAGIDLSRDCVLDPVETDFFTPKLEETLKAIKNPPPAAAAAQGELAKVLGDTRPRGSRTSKEVSPADILWGAEAMHKTQVARDAAKVRQRLEAHGVQLNGSQWGAWQAALTRRLQPIWGPPGTGKSRTMRAIGLGAAVDANDNGRPIRILVGASTYTAVDNVLNGLAQELSALLGSGVDLAVHRLRSSTRPPSTVAIDTEVSRSEPSNQLTELGARLTEQQGITVVGATPEQFHNMLRAVAGEPMAEAFDLLLLDEASQTDVAHAVLFAAGLAPDGCVVAAGDTRQLPPIIQAQPPLGFESLVGPFLSFLEDYHEIKPVPLEINYRSNEAIVRLEHVAGYDAGLKAASPGLRLDLDPPGVAVPQGWPQNLVWTRAWDELIDADRPVVAYTYSDPHFSSQWNAFEAQLVASLLAALRLRMQQDLLNELDGSGKPIQRGGRQLIDEAEFWARGVGVVTPHRAQQALILRELQLAFPQAANDQLRGAVDTVERFQGQQRDVIVVSYALGDPDAIAEEDEFLMSFSRFNVAASRARAKLIVVVSQQVISHLSGEVDVLHDSKLLKQFASTFCSSSRDLSLSYLGSAGVESAIDGTELWHP